MEYLSVAEAAESWGVSEKTVRSYCNNGRILGAVKIGKHWGIPKDAEKPRKIVFRRKKLLAILAEEKGERIKGGIYHKTQIELTYNSNHIEGSRLSKEQTRYIFETKTIGVSEQAYSVNDIIETVNHFMCVDYIIDRARWKLSEILIKAIHKILKNSTVDSGKDYFAVGDYKRLPNEIGTGIETCLPERVPMEMKRLLEWYNGLDKVGFDDLLDFHVRFEKIHPFQDGNGRVGRLIMFKECLNHNIVPFIIEDDLKQFYYRGLQEWQNERGYLRDTCLSCQDRYKAYMDYFRIKY